MDDEKIPFNPLLLSKREAARKIAMLTSRQKYALLLLARGASYKQAAAKMKIHYGTFQTYVYASCLHMGVDNTMQAVVLMVRALGK